MLTEVAEISDRFTGTLQEKKMKMVYAGHALKRSSGTNVEPSGPEKNWTIFKGLSLVRTMIQKGDLYVKMLSTLPGVRALS